MSDLFDLFDPMPYMKFIESVKRPKGGPRPSANAPKVPLVDDLYRKFNKVSRSWPDADLVMLDAAVADQRSRRRDARTADHPSIPNVLRG